MLRTLTFCDSVGRDEEVPEYSQTRDGYIPMKWAIPLHKDTTAYNNAAKALLSEDTSDEDFNHAATLVGNWRASHRYPLHAITMSLRGRVRKIDKKAVVVQRSKRMASIIPKLLRMRLTQIQDLGGCRAVLTDLRHLNKLHAVYTASMLKKDSRRPYMNGEPKNYIEQPKVDGYRGIHYVFRYRSEQKEYRCFNEMKIEVQIRTRAQHSWATALEIVDMFTGQNLKSDLTLNQADPDWKRFFALTSTVIALIEGCPVVPGTPTDKAEIIAELDALCKKLDVFSRFDGYGTAVNQIIGKHLQKGGEYLVIFDTQKRELNLTVYAGKEKKNLDADYLSAEKKHLGQSHIQVVQVKAKSLDDFKRGYPNYEIDTSAFAHTIKQALAGF